MTTARVSANDEVRPAASTRRAPVRASAGWLALRREVDTEARDDGANGLLDLLVEHLHRRGTEALTVVDVGAGTGANQAYLSPRLPFEQSWVVVDHDPELLAHAGHHDAVRVRAEVRDLVEVLDGLVQAPPKAEEPGGMTPEHRSRRTPQPTLLTCTALLDVLTAEDLRCLADAIERVGGTALLALSVTGGMEFSPPDVDDSLLRRAFDDHQREGGRPGPAAAEVLRHSLLARGLTVVTAPTPWRLDARRPELLARWLDERVAAAMSQYPQVSGRLHAWRVRRLEQLLTGQLRVRVEHDDLLVLPG